MRFLMLVLLAAAMALTFLASGCHDGGSPFEPPIVEDAGAVFTTDGAGTLNINLFGDKEDVNLNGGPAYPTAAGLPDGSYYLKITTLSGEVLGKSDGPVVIVSGGYFTQVYTLWDIVFQTDASGNFLLDGGGNKIPGYRDSPNDEYKVTVNLDSAFPTAGNKTDSFKIDSTVEAGEDAILRIVKFYDANANGINDDDQLLNGWRIRITGDDKVYDRFTPVNTALVEGIYTLSESAPLQSNWIPTTPTSMQVALFADTERTVAFGNTCIGPGGAESKTFWMGCNEDLIGSDDLAMLAALHLRNSNGSDFTPASADALRKWLVAATSNMAYKLSAQLAVLALNVHNGLISGSALVYAPDVNSANALGFTTVDALIAEADAELAAHPTAYSDDSWRPYQTELRDVVENANKDLIFVQSTPGAFSF